MTDATALLGLAERAYRLALQSIKDRAGENPDPALLPGTQFAVARMRAALDTMSALATRQGGLVARYYIAGEAEQVVSAAYGLIGPGAEIGEIWRDIKVPFDADRARELIGKAALGIDPNETPRWL
jgi:alkylation response protein AidB-like acyl-CoA dehydrogenase